MPTVIAIDEREKEITDHVRATLADVAASDAPDDLVFANILTVDDLDSFLRIDDPLKAGKKTDAGIVVGEVGSQDGSDDTEKSVITIPISVVVRFYQKRAPGQDENAATDRGKKLAQIVRDAVLMDRSRGGKTNLVRAGGRVINGTELDGTMRFVSRDANQMFYALVIPFICAYSVFS